MNNEFLEASLLFHSEYMNLIRKKSVLCFYIIPPQIQISNSVKFPMCGGSCRPP